MNGALKLLIEAGLIPESVTKLGQQTYQTIKDATAKGFKDGVAEVSEAVASTRVGATSMRGIETRTNRAGEEAGESVKKQTQAEKETDDKKLKALQTMNTFAVLSANTIQSLVKSSLGILEDIYNRLKAASPLLESIESIFNLAMMLFFMPLGNKLGELLIPAVLELLDSVVAMWEAFDGMTLGEMVEYMITYGVMVFSSFFYDIADLLIEQGGWLGNIGRMMNVIATFIENGLISTVNVILTVVTFIVGHLKELIALFIGFQLAHIALMMALLVIESSNPLQLAGAAAAAALIATVGAVVAYGGMSVMGMADGGYVPATEGGQLRILGEGGQGEYVIPEDRINNIRGNTTITYNISGVTSEELKGLIKDTLNDEISSARLRSAF